MIIFRKTKSSHEDRRLISALALNYEANQVVSAAKVDDLKAKHPEFVEQIDKVFAADPTPQKKYLQWATDRVVDGENVDEVIEVMTEFNSEAHRLPQKDIYNKSVYKTLKDVVDALNEVSKDREGVSEKQFRTAVGHGSKESKRLVKTKDADYLYHSKNLLVVYVKTKKASCHFGFGTGWCITVKEANYFNTYRQNDNSYFYFIIDKNKSTEGIAKGEPPPGSKLNDPWAKVALQFQKAAVSEGPGGIPGVSDVIAWPLDDRARPLGQVLMHFKKLYGKEIIEALDIVYDHFSNMPDNWAWVLASNNRVNKLGGYKALYETYKGNSEFKAALVPNVLGDKELLNALALDSSPEVRLEVAKNTKTPDLLELLINDTAKVEGQKSNAFIALNSALDNFYYNPSPNWGTVFEKATTGPVDVRALIAEKCPKALFNEKFSVLLDDKSPAVTAGLMKNMFLPAEVKAKLVDKLFNQLESASEDEELDETSLSSVEPAIESSGPIAVERLLKTKNKKVRYKVVNTVLSNAYAYGSIKDKWLDSVVMLAANDDIGVRTAVAEAAKSKGRSQNLPEKVVSKLLEKDVNNTIAIVLLRDNTSLVPDNKIDELLSKLMYNPEEKIEDVLSKIYSYKPNHIFNEKLANDLIASNRISLERKCYSALNMPLSAALFGATVPSTIFDFYIKNLPEYNRQDYIKVMMKNSKITDQQFNELFSKVTSFSKAHSLTEYNIKELIVEHATPDFLSSTYEELLSHTFSNEGRKIDAMATLLRSKKLPSEVVTSVIDNLSSTTETQEPDGTVVTERGGELAQVLKNNGKFSTESLILLLNTLISNKNVSLSEENIRRIAEIPEVTGTADTQIKKALAENKKTPADVLRVLIDSYNFNNWRFHDFIAEVCKNPNTTTELLDYLITKPEVKNYSSAGYILSNDAASVEAIRTLKGYASNDILVRNRKTPTDVLDYVITREVSRSSSRGYSTEVLEKAFKHPNTPVETVLKYITQKKSKVSDAAKAALAERPDRPPPPKRGRKPKTAVEPAAEAAPMAAEEVVGVEAAYLKEAVHNLAEIFHLLPVSAFALLAVEEAAALLEE